MIIEVLFHAVWIAKASSLDEIRSIRYLIKDTSFFVATEERQQNADSPLKQHKGGL
jgi:hypothetical protein